MSYSQKAWFALTGLWDRESILSAFLLFLIVKAFVLPAIITVGLVGQIITDVFFALMLITGALSVPQKRLAFRTMLIVALITLAIHWISWFFKPEVTMAAREWSNLASLLVFTGVVLTKVMSVGPITRARIEGAVAAYLLLGLSWASAYELVHMHDPQAFQGNLAAVGPGLTFSYFSFVTLTTVGYGDITPVLPLARSLAVTEALTGQLYIAILLASLVSQQLLQKKSQ